MEKFYQVKSSNNPKFMKWDIIYCDGIDTHKIIKVSDGYKKTQYINEYNFIIPYLKDVQLEDMELYSTNYELLKRRHYLKQFMKSKATEILQKNYLIYYPL